jgi:hypothetical protein
MNYRWSDNDKRWGPFIFSKNENKVWAITLESSGEDEDLFTIFRISFSHQTFIIVMKPWLKSYKRLVRYKSRQIPDAPTIENSIHVPIGPVIEKSYIEEIKREYGFSLHEEMWFFQLFWGPQENNWPSDIGWYYSCFIPWLDRRHIRVSFYDTNGNHFYTVPDNESMYDYMPKKNNCPKKNFSFIDFDGEEISASTIIEEREWQRGTGWFKWLSLFYRPIIHRSLDIEFSKETGEKKGSWKGGIVGHSIEMLSNELHEDAFKRYCLQNKMTFKGELT